MKKLIILSLVLSMSLFSTGQNKTIKKETISGYLVETEMIDGNKNGTEKIFYQDGGIRSISHFVNNKREGIAKIYYRTGELEYETPYLNDKKEGHEKGYYQSGKPKSSMHFEKNIVIGIFEDYYESGGIKTSTETLNGRRNGEEIQYDENGGVVKRLYWVSGGKGGTLSMCEGIEFIVNKLKRKEFDKLKDEEWMNENFAGIKRFEFDFFEKGNNSTIENSYCAFSFMEIKNKEDLYVHFNKQVAEMDACKNLSGKEQENSDGGKSVKFDYNKNIYIYLNANKYTNKISLDIYLKMK